MIWHIFSSIWEIAKQSNRRILLWIFIVTKRGIGTWQSVPTKEKNDEIKHTLSSLCPCRVLPFNANALPIDFASMLVNMASNMHQNQGQLSQSRQGEEIYFILPKKETTTTYNNGKMKVKATDEEEKEGIDWKEVVQQQPARRCTHCLAQRTPHWRAGPLGPRTLCNTCGMRHKFGRLLPEYRPAMSPTFVGYLHSNSHEKVLQIRKAPSLPK